MFCGFDCGEKGAIAFIDAEAKLVSYAQYESHQDYMIDLKGFKPILTAVEKLWGYPVSSAGANFNLGWHYGRTQLILEQCGVSYQEVAAQTWQGQILNYRGNKVIKGAAKKKESKMASIGFVQKKYPQVVLPSKTLKQIDESSGIADAICIALYARFIHLNLIGE